MVRKIVATIALSGAVVLGGTLGALAVSAPAGAATAGSGTATAPHAPNCAKAPARLAHLAALESKAQSWLPGARQRQSAAVQQGRPKVAARIQRRIDRVERLEARGTRLQQRIEAACPGSST
jgi:hypothetical protein